MKLSEAINLGRSLAKPAMDVWMNKDSGCACAIGMAELATGQTVHDWDEVLAKWPWLSDIHRVLGKCPGCDLTLQGMGISAISHVMCHVIGTANDKWGFVGQKTITMDQLVEWVRSIEPNEESEVTNVNSNASTTGQQSNQGRVAVATKTSE